MTRKKKLNVTPLRVKLFASAREIAGGKSEIVIEFEQKPIKFIDLRERIIQIYPKLKNIPFVFSVDCKIVSDKPTIDTYGNNTTTMATTITAADEIALLPPISGG
jgi:molybdopterin converting factor small subunit